ncbi:MAG: 1-deoxy-D-xylulose-5-phosphate synthase [Fusobacteriaceae bacterium]
MELKEMNIEQLRERASEIRKLLISTVSKNGGHLAPNLGIVELTMIIHKVFDSPKDKIIFDVGHQSYVHKILTGREENFSTIRQRNGLGPFTDPHESIHDHFISGHGGTGLSAACGIAKANPDSKVIVIIGDASIANGHSLEALNNMSEGSKNIIVVLNDNEMSIGKNVGSLSNFLSSLMATRMYWVLRRKIRGAVNRGRVGRKVTGILERVEYSTKQFFAPLSILGLLGFKFYGVIDGHSLENLQEAFERIKAEDEGPFFVHVKTKKGKGYSFAEEDREKFHGVAPFDQETGGTISSKKNNETYSQVFGRKLCELAEKDQNIMTISAAMIKGVGLENFEQKFPDRTKDVGIAEGHGTTYSAGLAISGKKPYFAVYATFIQRAFSQLIHDVSLQKLPVKFIIDRAGIAGEDGKTHHGLYDIGIFLTVPNFFVFAPTTKKELEEVLDITKNIKDEGVAIRYPKETACEIELPEKFQIGKWQEVCKGEKVLIIATGSMFQEIMSIKDQLKFFGINPTIVSATSIKPLDESYISKNFLSYEKVFVLEEGYCVNSFGSSIVNYLNEKNISKKIHKICFETGTIPHGSRDILMREFGMRGEKLLERFK